MSNNLVISAPQVFTQYIFKDKMLICTEGVEFSFSNVQIYIQRALRWGKNLGPVLLNISVVFYKDRFFENVHRSSLYYWYVKDTFDLFYDEQGVVGFLVNMSSWSLL